jgi:hypothetical protein
MDFQDQRLLFGHLDYLSIFRFVPEDGVVFGNDLSNNLW